MNMNYNSENSKFQNLTNSDGLVELSNDDLDNVAGGIDFGGRILGSFIHRRVRDVKDTVGGFIKGVLFG